MDTSDLLTRGARSLVIDLCKQLEETVALVPSLQKFARMLAHETLGLKRGPYNKGLNGDDKVKLADQLVEARERRLKARSKKANAARKPMSDESRERMSRAMKARWAAARKAGVVVKPGQGSPTKAAIEAAKAAKANAAAKGTNTTKG